MMVIKPLLEKLSHDSGILFNCRPIYRHLSKKNQQSYNSQLTAVDSEFITFHEQS